MGEPTMRGWWQDGGGKWHSPDDRAAPIAPTPPVAARKEAEHHGVLLVVAVVLGVLAVGLGMSEVTAHGVGCGSAISAKSLSHGDNASVADIFRASLTRADCADAIKNRRLVAGTAAVVAVTLALTAVYRSNE